MQNVQLSNCQIQTETNEDYLFTYKFRIYTNHGNCLSCSLVMIKRQNLLIAVLYELKIFF